MRNASCRDRVSHPDPLAQKVTDFSDSAPDRDDLPGRSLACATGEELILVAHPGLADEVKTASGQDVHRCYQCLKCTAGCPMTAAMDQPPARLMRLIQFGQEDLVLSSRTLWVCLSCNTCSVRCPNGIDIAHVIDCLRERCLKKGFTPAVESVALFHRIFLDDMTRRGRTFEAGMLARLQLRTGQAARNARAGVLMLIKGRIALLPHGVENKKAFRQLCRRIAGRGTDG